VKGFLSRSELTAKIVEGETMVADRYLLVMVQVGEKLSSLGESGT